MDGTTHTRAIADSMALGTPTLIKPNYRVLAANPIGLADSVLKSIGFNRSIADALGLGDSVLQSVAYARAIADAIGLADTHGIGSWSGQEHRDS